MKWKWEKEDGRKREIRERFDKPLDDNSKEKQNLPLMKALRRKKKRVEIEIEMEMKIEVLGS